MSTTPVLKQLRPRLIMKETNYLSLEQLKRLLSYISGKAYELAIWLGVYLGLRVGEIQALRWQDVDFEKQLIHIRRTNLSHSTSELYMAHGATRDDLRILFAHSSASVTDRTTIAVPDLKKSLNRSDFSQVEQKTNKRLLHL
jgi:hypothetical protein